MKKSILLLCTAGLLTANLCIPAAGVSLANIRSNLPATPAVQGQTDTKTDAKGTVSFQNLQLRMRTENLTIRSLQATLDSQKAFDYKVAYNDLVDGINALSDAAWGLSQAGKDISSLQANVESMHKQLDSLKEEEYSETMEKISLQIEQSIQQIIMGGESLYLNILSTESTLSDLNRSLKTLETNMREMELRYTLGQISELTLQQFKSTYSSTKSQAVALEQSLKNMKASLQVLLGTSPTGGLTLAPLPAVSQKQTALLLTKYDTALQIAKEKSLTLALAKNTLNEAKETWDDVKDDYSYSSYKYKMAEQTYRSAVYTYESTVSDFEYSFQSLYSAIPDAQQTLNAAESTYTYQKQSYETAKLKHQLGQLSDTALKAAEDAMLTAKSALSSAQMKVYSAWNNYEWALERGMVG